MATLSSIPAWKIPWTEEPARLLSMESQDFDTTWHLNHHHHLQKKKKKNCLHLLATKIEVAQSCLTLTTPQTVAGQAPLSVGSPRQEYWSGLPFPAPGDHPLRGLANCKYNP